jgi:hypothetical protein
VIFKTSISEEILKKPEKNKVAAEVAAPRLSKVTFDCF